jgi:hypothetical protein
MMGMTPPPDKPLEVWRGTTPPEPAAGRQEWRCINCKEIYQGVEMPDRCGSCCCSSFAKVAQKPEGS